MTAPPEYIYRYRSPDALLWKHHELERQEIFLASPHDLNDPMEGYRDVVWEGDSVLWENLLRHYILSLLCLTVECFQSSDTDPRLPVPPIRLDEDELPAGLREVHEKAVTSFFSKASTRALQNLLCERGPAIRREELQAQLQLIHLIAWDSVQEALKEMTGWQLPASQTIDSELAANLKEISSAPQTAIEAKVPELFYEIANHFGSQVVLAQAYNHNRAAPQLKRQLSVLLGFPEHYVTQLIAQLLNPPWYTACFSATCTNASMWAMYAKGHEGFVLKFRPARKEDGRFTLPVGDWSHSSWVRGQPAQPTRRRVDATLHAVRYSERPSCASFFRFLGYQLPNKVARRWYTDRQGKQSPLLAEILASQAEWREEFWRHFNDSATAKLRDWSHEEEYRVVAADQLGLRENCHKYDFEFSSLHGIIFGLRTSLADKLRVIEIVQQKCEEAGRKEFEFLQAKFSPTHGKLKVHPMPLLKFH